MRFNVILSTAIFSLLFSTVTAIGAENTFTPSIAVSEEYNDNVFEDPAKREDFITRVMPGFTLNHKAPFWDLDMGYIFDYRHYGHQVKGDEITHDLKAKGNLRVVDNFLFLDLSDTYHKVSLDVARDTTNESLFVNQTDQNIATVSPYLLWRLSEKSSIKTGYRYIDTRYWGGGIDKTEHVAFADLTHELTSRLSLTAGYAFTRCESSPDQYDKNDIYGGFRYEYADKSFVFGRIGNTWLNFSSSNNMSYLNWDAGVTHDLGFAVLALATKCQTTEDPQTLSTKETSYSGKIDKTFERGAVGFSSSYSEYKNNETGVMEGRNLSFRGYGRYEVLPSLTASLGVTSERFKQESITDYPYRFTFTSGLSYAFKNELTLGLTYTYVTYLYHVWDTSTSNDINRAIVEVRKVF